MTSCFGSFGPGSMSRAAWTSPTPPSPSCASKAYRPKRRTAHTLAGARPADEVRLVRAINHAVHQLLVILAIERNGAHAGPTPMDHTGEEAHRRLCLETDRV